jgi:hypothetical protein
MHCNKSVSARSPCLLVHPVCPEQQAFRANNTRSAQAEVVPERDPGRASTERPDLGRCRGVSGAALQTGG